MKSNLFLYLVGLLTFSWVFAFVIYQFSPNAAEFLPIIYMFLPGLFTLVWSYLNYGHLRNLKWHLKKPWWKYLLVLYLPVLYYAVLTALSVSLFNTETFEYTEKTFTQLPVVLTVGVMSSLFLIPLALGEEIAWRGFLQDRLINNFGTIKGILLLGIIWGFWHWPIAFKGHNLPEQFIWIEILFYYPLICVAFSIFIFIAMKKTNSIWIACIFHASNNMVYGIVNSKTEIIDPKAFLILRVFFVIIITLITILYFKSYFITEKKALPC